MEQSIATAQTDYERDGFCLMPDVLGSDLVPGAIDVLERVVFEDPVTGVEPLERSCRPADDPTRLVKIDQPQMADPAITRMLEKSRIGEIAAELTGADFVQCWAVQLLYKPPTTGATANVGWHQDEDYWQKWWTGEVFTCWLALSEVTEDAGPMKFVRGSHEWGFLSSGNFFDMDIAHGQQSFPVPAHAEWSEISAILAPGQASFHHRRTIHGSGPNMSGGPRRSYAVHLRTDRSTQMPDAPKAYMDQLDNQDLAPVLFRR